MSAHVQSIVTAMKASVSTVVGAGWDELPFVQDLSKNNKRTSKFAYGVRPLEANPAEGNILRSIFLDHKFEIILTDSIASRGNDLEIMSSLEELYDQADEIFKVLVNSKISLPDLVIVVSEPSMLAPEIIENAKIVALRLQLKVKYRSDL